MAALACVFLGAIDLTIVAAILPTMIDDLGINTADIDRYIWAVNGYLIAYVVAIPAFGRLSDVTSRQRALQVSLIIFLVGSIACATAESLSDLVVGRTIQGLGGGGILPVTMALVADRLPRRQQIGAMGLVGALETLGWVIGPLYGAGIVTLLDTGTSPWRLVFWLNVPLLVIAFVAVQRFAAPAADRPRVTKVGWPALLSLTTALIALNLALTSGSEIGTTTSTGLRALGGTPNPLASWSVPLLGFAIVSVIVLVVIEARSAAPLLPNALRSSRVFIASLAANTLVGASLMIVMVNVPVIVSLSASSAGTAGRTALYLAPFTLALAIGSLMTERLNRRRHPARVSMVGIIGASLGMSMTWAILADRPPSTMLPFLALAGAGLGLVLPFLGAVALISSSATHRGAAASFAMMFRLLGMTLGLSAASSAAMRRLQSLTDDIEPVRRLADESTAEFLTRQQRYIEDVAIPLAIQVVRETFLIGGVLMVISIWPVIRSLREVDRVAEPDVDREAADLRA